jgi:hypothetical protein
MLALKRTASSLARLSSLTSTFSSSANQIPGVIELYKRNDNLPFWSVHNPTPVLAFTTLHTTYWAWYNISFNPLLIDAGLSINPTWAYGGMGASLFMSAAAIAFTRHLISSIEYLQSNPREGYLRLRTHSLPFGFPEKGEDGGKVFKVGDVKIEVNASFSRKTHEPQYVLHKGNGYQAFWITDEAAAKYRLNYLVDVDLGDIYEGGGKGYSLAEKVLIDGVVPVELGEKKRTKRR